MKALLFAILARFTLAQIFRLGQDGGFLGGVDILSSFKAMNTLFGKMTKSEEYVSSIKSKHSKKGAFWSPEGNHGDVQQRIKLQEEEEEIRKMDAEGTYKKDYNFQKKAFAFFQKQQASPVTPKLA